MKKSGFTLVELLIVISIIALLASVVLAALNTARDRGRIGAGTYFATQIKHIAGDENVLSYNFDECSGTPRDSSGQRNDGVFQSTPVWSADTPSGKGCSLYFDGVDDAVRANGIITFSTLYGPSTVSLWFKASSVAAGNVKLFSDNCFEWGIFRNGSTIAGAAYNTASAGTISQDKWYQLTLVHEHPTGTTNTLVKIYLDGVFKGSTTWTLGAENGYNDSPYWIGADGCTAGTYFNGYIDEVNVFTKALTAAEIGKRYALETIKFLAKD